MNKLKDCDIRKLLLNELFCIYSDSDDSDNTKIVNEMGILNGSSRVDVAVINGSLHGYEIKSESDNLQRLPNQIKDYNKVFERMTIVVQRNYLKQVRKMVPKWWGITLVTKYNGNYNLRVVRKGRKNVNIDPYSISQLLWREEALEILKEKDLHKGYLSKPKKEIYKRLSESLDIVELKMYVLKQLRKRENWLNGQL